MSNARCLLPVLLLLSLSACGAGEPAELVQAERDTAAKLVAAFASSLKAELQTAIAEGGPVAGIRTCAERAPSIATEVTANHPDWSLRRIGTRVRNAATNTPTEAERAVLDSFAAMPADQRPGPLAAADPDQPRRLYKPIFIAEPICLTCHGPAEQLAPEVRGELAKHYPDDAATGYAMGDLRGAFVVEKR